MPLVPEMLGYEGSQVLLIGEGFEGGVGEGKKEAVGEVERLEEEVRFFFVLFFVVGVG